MKLLTNIKELNINKNKYILLYNVYLIINLNNAKYQKIVRINFKYLIDNFTV
jgi:hypothetical protein